MKEQRTIGNIPLEAWIWLGAMLVLAMLPSGTSDHFSVCIPRALGLSWCWGCGVGESVGMALRGNLVESFSVHPMGPVAVVVLLFRLVQLLLHHHKLPR